MGTPIYVAPASTNEPTVDHEPSVSLGCQAPSAEHESRSSWDSIARTSMAVAVSSISCSLRRPPAPVREASARLTPPKTTAATPWSDGLRRACVAAAAACVVIGTAGGGGDVAASTTPRPVAVAAPRWSERRECPPWRANSLENIVPENLPRPSARRRFNTIKRAPRKAPALGRAEAVAPFLALRFGVDDCFTL